MDKLINFSPELIEKIQDYANKNFNGNFSKAIRSLCDFALTELNGENS